MQTSGSPTFAARSGRLRGQEKELLALRFEQSISRELFKGEQRRIATRIADIEAQIERLENTRHNYEAQYAKAADLVSHFPELYRKAPSSVRRQCNRAIIDRLRLKGPKIT